MGQVIRLPSVDVLVSVVVPGINGLKAMRLGPVPGRVPFPSLELSRDSINQESRVDKIGMAERGDFRQDGKSAESA